MVRKSGKNDDGNLPPREAEMQELGDIVMKKLTKSWVYPASEQSLFSMDALRDAYGRSIILEIDPDRLFSKGRVNIFTAKPQDRSIIKFHMDSYRDDISEEADQPGNVHIKEASLPRGVNKTLGIWGLHISGRDKAEFWKAYREDMNQGIIGAATLVTVESNMESIAKTVNNFFGAMRSGAREPEGGTRGR